LYSPKVECQKILCWLIALAGSARIRLSLRVCEHSFSEKRSPCRIHISHSESDVRVEVQDKGKGMSPVKRSEMKLTGKAGVGIRAMRERLRQLGGALEMSSGGNGPGTIVIARLPISRTSVSNVSKCKLRQVKPGDSRCRLS
jgi:signal transduction histidine kinase